MKHIFQLRRLQETLKLYQNYVPYCSEDDLPRIVAEIIKIIGRIETLKSMSIEELNKKAVVYFETKQSKLNFNATPY